MEESNELIERLNSDGELPLITSCCPGWVKYAEHFYPDMLENISTCKSPHQMQGAIVKTYMANQEHIAKKYKAKKYIAYFQNYTNTFLPLNDFRKYMEEAAQFPDITELAVSTRPDCIKVEYLDVLRSVSEQYHCNITIELGLQTANYHTLLKIDRGHTLAEYIDAAIQIKRYGFDLCTHVILNLPGDTITDSIETAKILSALSNDCVKVHSLYIAKNTRLCEEYENGTITCVPKKNISGV